MPNQHERLLEVIQTTLEVEHLSFEDYERTFRYYLVLALAKDPLSPDHNALLQMFNLYRLLWLLKPYFQE